jgi:RimJ/RimL family protein N-acetyltransferase
MSNVSELETNRLKLRQWRDDDLAPFAALNADPEVMRYFPATMTRAQSDEFAGYVRDTIARQGWGLWAVEVTDGPAFVGFVGLNRVSFEEHFTPAVEVGWRLARPFWGNGYATEAAAAAVTFGFDQLDLEEIVSFTAPINEPSIRVMRRLGMRHDAAGDFDHPRVADGSPLRRHVLYRLAKHPR